MSLVAVPARPGKWVDTSNGSALTDSVLDELVGAQVVGLFLYVTLSQPGPGDVTASLLSRATAKGLQVSLVQHVRGVPHQTVSKSGETLPPMLWVPADYNGASDANVGAAHGQSVGFPGGAHLAQDLEACHGTSFDSATYTDRWGTACKANGFLHRLYVGYSTLLSPLSLYQLRTPNSYWSDAGHREVAVRGVDTTQGEVITIGGVQFDTDIVAPDLKGDVFMAAAA